MPDNDRINKILQNEQFVAYLKKNIENESSRPYCKHDLVHFLDVARIAYIINLEKELCYKKDVVYCAALLHDIGKWQQYEQGIPHHIASAKLAVSVLRECGYDGEETELITSAILHHREQSPESDTLNAVLYDADKKSRVCFACLSLDTCNWEQEKKNDSLLY